MGFSFLHNVSMSVVGLGVSKALRFFYLGLCIRAVGADGWGELAFAFTLLGYLLLLEDGGRSQLATLQSLGSPAWHGLLRRSMVYPRFVTGCAIYLLLLLQSLLFPYQGAEAVVLYGLVLLVKPFLPEWQYLRAERSGLLNLQVMVRHALLLGVLLLWPGTIGVREVAWFEVAGEVLLVAMGWVLLRRVPGRRKPYWSLRHERLLLRKAWPLFLLTGVSMLHLSGDILVLRVLAPLSELGVYDAAYRFVNFFLLFGTALSMAVRPIQVRWQQSGKSLDQLMLALRRTVFVPAIVFLWVVQSFGEQGFRLILPEEAVRASGILWILSLYVVLTFQSMVLSEWFLVSHGRIAALRLLAIAGFGNIVLNFCTIPWWGIQAAAWVTVAVEAVMLGYYSYCWAISVSSTTRGKAGRDSLAMGIVTLGLVLAHSLGWTGWLPALFLGVGGLVLLSALRWIRREDLRVLQARGTSVP